jgi:single-stranded-DNA-specific exonuclease
MEEKWIVINKKTEFDKLKGEVNLHPLIVRLLANRGIVDKEQANYYLNGTIEELYDGRMMKDMLSGVSLIKKAIEGKNKIVIYGDYDCDGVCSTTILYKTLKKLGANFIYYIPNREEEGYGMNKNRIQLLKEQGIEYILTCDNGISAIEEVQLAKELGMKVIITDHHDIPYIEEDNIRKEVIPEADCIINPKQNGCKYPFKELCGAGVALKFSKVLLEEMGANFDEFIELYEFAALATVCDVVSLLGENRIIVKEGLKLINNTKNKGLLELIKATGNEGKKIGEYHFGFVLGPCINATGRLETADLSVELLITDDEEKAKELATKLRLLNNERQQKTEESLERVKEKIKSEVDEKDKVILIYDKQIHESIAGIVAGRIRERYNLPTIIMTSGKDMPKGSARSIEAYNMFEELNKCKEFIYKFGGHPMAAGLSVKEEMLPLLKKALLEKCPLTDEDVIPIIKIESPLDINYLNEKLVVDIESLRPFGKSNPSPLFATKNVKAAKVIFIGKEKKYIKIMFVLDEKKNTYIEGINFDKYDDFKEMIVEKYGEERFNNLLVDGYAGFNIDIIYYPSINEFNGKKNIQLMIKNFRM